MTDKNPNLALQSLLEVDNKPQDTVLHPITIARYALLEAIDSPFLTGYAKSILELIPSLYILVQPIDKLKGYNVKTIDKLKDKATEWADQINDLSYISNLLEDAVEKLKEIAATSPKSTTKKV